MKELPKKVFVMIVNQDTKDEYLECVSEDPYLFSEAQGTVGIYELKETKKMTTVTVLE